MDRRSGRFGLKTNDPTRQVSQDTIAQSEVAGPEVRIFPVENGGIIVIVAAINEEGVLARTVYFSNHQDEALMLIREEIRKYIKVKE